MDPSFTEYGRSNSWKLEIQSIIQNIMANIVDLDETPRDESSHLDIHCLQRYLFWSAGMHCMSVLSLYVFACGSW